MTRGAGRTRRRGGVLLAGLLLLLTGCGLPVQSGVRTPQSATGGDQVAGADEPATAAYLPPGPRAGQLPLGVVRGFLRAQASADGDHQIARRFLAADLRQSWNDDAQVKVYDPAELEFQLLGDQDDDAVQVRVTGVVTSTIGGDGSLGPEDEVLDDTYSLRRAADGTWVLTDVPDGLRLTTDFVELSYTQQLVYYLARGTGPQGHLVPDPALLLNDKEPAAGLVRRLVAGPSSSLAVDTAVPAGAQVLAVTTDAEGVVTVDLGPEVAELTAAGRERLSAQLVWTLRGIGPAFTSLRLLSAGRPVEVPGVDGPTQDRTAWEDYDPDGLPESVTTYFLADRRLRTLERGGRPVPATADLAVDSAAVSPRTDRLAVLTELGDGRSEVRIGPLSGPVPAPPVHTGAGLRSPSWGDGRRGLWLLQTGQPSQVLLLQPDGEVLPVPIPDPPPGSLAAIRVSRDGARIALVAGEDEASRRVYVAPVIDSDGGLRIGRPREIGFGVTGVSDVAWESPTSVVALGRYREVDALPVRLSIDGSGTVDVVQLPGLQQVTPESLAAGPDRPLVVSATRDGRPVIFRSAGGVFEQAEPGSAPHYPG